MTAFHIFFKLSRVNKHTLAPLLYALNSDSILFHKNWAQFHNQGLPLVLILIIADQILNGVDDFFLQIQLMFM